MEINNREEEAIKRKIFPYIIGAVAGVVLTCAAFVCSPPDVEYIKPFQENNQKLMRVYRSGLDGIFVEDPISGNYFPRQRNLKYKNK